MIRYSIELKKRSANNGSLSASNIKFSRRELEILKLLSQGFNSREIAKKLFVSYHTINTHRRAVLRRSGYPNMVSLIAWCIKAEIIG